MRVSDDRLTFSSYDTHHLLTVANLTKAALGALPDKIADAVANKTLKTADQKQRDYTGDRGN